MTPAHQRDGNTEESRAGLEALLVVVLVAEDVVQPTESGEGARHDHRAQPDAPDAHPAILCRLRLEPDGAQLDPRARAEEEPPREYGRGNREKNRRIRRRAMKSRYPLAEAGKPASPYLLRV
jgi:hypothetical protein